MPLFDFACECGRVREVFFRSQAAVVDEAKCECGKTSRRRAFGKFAVVGPVWADLDAHSERLGIEVKQASDVRRWEREHGLEPMSSYEAKVAKEESGHISKRISGVARERGTEAAADLVHEINMCESMGWTKERYQQFKESDNAAASIQQSIGDAATALPTPGVG